MIKFLFKRIPVGRSPSGSPYGCSNCFRNLKSFQFECFLVENNGVSYPVGGCCVGCKSKKRQLLARCKMGYLGLPITKSSEQASIVRFKKKL